ncbi:gamma-glutamyl-gamma-aminobutyrate hydrolase family protein [Arthrobacter bambusae]|uniref:gamma-glutamyl-gamma-aminobutyrate hydrolase family protein n=1 Tax=Arthrobacter bambusae TaxID=1338426 RepID=UPI002788A088|nr:gamma-glutamyl-gamma-aminobutyrate hydrolase family protein [Arthrobacter bambusae]MDQ0029914.1 putative glutamine amidotransferase [Arthrobacter bambusae]MDQ0097568.1 putative glutamine amidotransferase [Arthrobacter bambusae]
MTNRDGRVRTLAPITPADVIPQGLAELPGNAPIIAVVVSLNFPDMTVEVSQLVKRFTRTALETLLKAGARAALVDSSATDLPDPKHVADASGVLFLGGGDVDPSLYGVSGPVPNLYGVERRADEYCMELIDQTLARDAPLLAICRGSQLLNLTCGGTLIPDLDPYQLHRGGKGESMFLDEPVTVLPGSRLHKILGRERVIVRSGHHQAVEQVGPRLQVAAVADDGIIEGTEHKDNTWVVGVQWHPEDSDGNAEDRDRLFQAFVDQARLHSAHAQRHAMANTAGPVTN